MQYKRRLHFLRYRDCIKIRIEPFMILQDLKRMLKIRFLTGLLYKIKSMTGE